MKELHRCGFAHLDVRLDNNCFRLEDATNVTVVFIRYNLWMSILYGGTKPKDSDNTYLDSMEAIGNSGIICLVPPFNSYTW